MSQPTRELAIIGAGNMAEAIARGILAKNVLRADQMTAADVSADRRALFEKQLGIEAFDDNASAARDAKMILLSVKPQQMAAALGAMSSAIIEDTLIISIAAGIGSAFIEKNLGG